MLFILEDQVTARQGAPFKQPIYPDKSMGTCLIFRNRLFGSFKVEFVNEPVTYGLAKPMQNSGNPMAVIFYEWRNLYQDLTRNRSFANKMTCLSLPPLKP